MKWHFVLTRVHLRVVVNRFRARENVHRRGDVLFGVQAVGDVVY